MSEPRKCLRLMVNRSGRDVELTFAVEGGDTVRILASEDQVDRLVDELEDILDTPAEPDRS